MWRWRRETVDQPQDCVFQSPSFVSLVLQLGDDFRRLLLHFGERLIGAIQVVLKHLLLASQEFLSPEPVLLRPELHLCVGGLHLGKHFVLPFVALYLFGLDLVEPCSRGFLPGNRDFLPSSRFILKRRSALAARGAFGNYRRQFLPGHREDCAR